VQFFKYLAVIVGFSLVSSNSFGQILQVYTSYGPGYTASTSTFNSNALKVIQSNNPNIVQTGAFKFVNTDSLTAQEMISTIGISSWTGTFSPLAPYNVAQGDALHVFVVEKKAVGGAELSLSGNAVSIVPSDFDVNQTSLSFNSGSTFDETTAWGFDWADETTDSGALIPVTTGSTADVIVFADEFAYTANQSGYAGEVSQIDSSITGLNVQAFGSNGLSASEFISLDVPAVPEPSTLALLGFGSGFLALFFHRKRAQAPKFL